MKKEIQALLAAQNATLKLNKITRLIRWTEDGLGNKCDGLKVTFDSPSGSVFFYTQEIESRDLPGIINEVSEAFNVFINKYAKETITQFRAGRIDGTLNIVEE